MIFGTWGSICGVFCRLAIALNINSMAAITSAGNLGGLLAGATAEVLLAAASILFAVCVLLIPFLAKRLVEGDLGGTVPAGSGPVPPAPPSGNAVGGGSAPVTSSASDTGGHAPSGPGPSGGGSIGHHRPVNIPHAVGWLAGAVAGMGVRGGQRAVNAGHNLVKGGSESE